VNREPILVCLRYSLVPLDTQFKPKYTEKWGIHVNGTVDFARKVSCTVSRNGDLIHKVYLQVDLPALDPAGGANGAWIPYVGHALIDEVSIEIGGQTIN